VLSLNEREIELINSTTNVKIDVGKRRGSKIKTVAAASSSREGYEEALGDDPLEGPTLAAQLEHDPNVKLDVQVVSSDVVVAADSDMSGELPKRTPVSKQFVKLTDILPPLPAKGNFSVETIKKSLYFFS
jgi:DNA-directed RNA polymerase